MRIAEIELSIAKTSCNTSLTTVTQHNTTSVQPSLRSVASIFTTPMQLFHGADGSDLLGVKLKLKSVNPKQC